MLNFQQEAPTSFLYRPPDSVPGRQRLFKNVGYVADENLGDAFRNVMKTDEGTFDYKLNGKKITSIYQKSIPLGWYFFIVLEKRETAF